MPTTTPRDHADPDHGDRPRRGLGLGAESAETAKSFSRTRSDHHTETAEDYVELVALLIERHGEARIVDMARHLGISNGTVTRTVARLQKDGYLHSEPYRSVFLTPYGRDLAEQCHRRHQVVVSFLRALGVGEQTAHEDAEGIEHHVSAETLAAMERFLARGSKPQV